MPDSHTSNPSEGANSVEKRATLAPDLAAVAQGRADRKAGRVTMPAQLDAWLDMFEVLGANPRE